MTAARHILLQRSTPWDSPVQCSTKTYARLLRDRGWQVTYLEDLAHLGHLALRKPAWQECRKGPRFANGVWVMGALTAMPYLLPKRGQGLMAWLHYRLAWPGIQRTVLQSGQGQPDVIWITKPGAGCLQRLFPRARLVYNMVDNYAAYQGPHVVALDRQECQRADGVFVIGETLRELVCDTYGVPEHRIEVLGQGVDALRYAADLPEPEPLRRLPHPRAIWAGVMKKIDVPMLRALCEAMWENGGVVVLVGPAAPWTDELLAAYPNLYTFGSVPNDQLPAWLKACDLGWMLYDQTRQAIYQGQNPLKLYEYAAAGLPILSTPHHEYRSLQPPVIEVSSVAEIPFAVRSALDPAGQWKNRSLAFAQAHSWESCCDRAEARLGHEA